MIGFALRILANAAAIYFASHFIGGFTFSGNFGILAGIGLALAIFQLAIYPVLKIVAFPLVFLSFGLFGLILNMVVLLAISRVLPQLAIGGVIPLLGGALFVTIASTIAKLGI